MQDGNLNFRKKLFELYELLQDDLSRDIFWLRTMLRLLLIQPLILLG